MILKLSSNMTRKQKKLLIRILVALTLILGVTLACHFLTLPVWLEFALYLVPYLVIGYDVLKKAGKGILHGRAMDEKFLMAVATIGALALKEFPESVAVMLFYQVGELFESYAVGKSRKNVSDLMDIRPDYANIEKEGELVSVSPDQVPIGGRIVVNPGERVPLDGIVVDGESAVNTSALTGESVPRTLRKGDVVLSGSINETARLRIQTTKGFEESTASKILDLVENASSRKSKSEHFITKFAKIYTPVVCALALALALIPPLVHLALHQPTEWQNWLFRALTCLVVSCPCAIVVSVPLSFFGGIGGASKMGILIKGSNYLETLSQIDTIAFDKTGTVTKGNFEVSRVTGEQTLQWAAYAESASSHPIAQSILRAYGAPIDQTRVESVEELSGLGVQAVIDGHTVLVGNRKLVTNATETAEGTAAYVSVDGLYEGLIEIRDEIKPTAKKALQDLKKAGIRKTVMLTGDKQAVAEKVADELGIDSIYAELLPEGKVEKVEALLKENKVAFVGDGMNDAPVLARADLGIAMGALGSDAAIEAADVVLMDDHPEKIAKAVYIARKCMRIVYTNIIFAIAVKVLCLFVASVGMFGTGSMWIAIFGDVGVLILCILNAIRCLFVEKEGATV